ncbi:bacteriohemerythrin [Dechloromonas denitrificans]|uniref:bacteriohemerythrin n=1 Tax=Dechloromonas denitrificans TaxID=281362 RepID=UPI001CF893E1|nr:hemerythrin family protein [Dechloromonas denitrificans]UCV01827.1 hemerythrin family protein [Dechloromonas denitrificans]
MNDQIAVFLPDSLVVNVPEIDEQHAELFARLASLKSLCIEANCLPSDQAEALLEALRIHCSTEEAFAERAGLDFTVHANKHRTMLKGIEKTLAQVRQERMDIYSLIRYIEYWFERHIREEDIDLGAELQQRIFPTREQAFPAQLGCAEI